MVYNGAWPVSSGSALNTNTWSHVAVCRSGSTINLYINGVLGVLAGSATYTGNFSDGLCKIGSGSHGAFNGFIDEFRITKFARYTANFTPSTSAFLNHS